MADRRQAQQHSWDSYEGEPFARNPVVIAMGALLTTVIAVIITQYIVGDGDPQPTVADDLAVDTVTTDQVESGAGEDETPETQATAPTSAAPTGPYIEATLLEKDFVLRGVVPTAALASSYLRSAEIAYSPFVRSELMVDEEMEQVDWLSAGPDAIVLLPLITDGTIRISGDQVELSGRSPTQERTQKLADALAQLTELPVKVGQMTITGLAEPSLTLASVERQIELRGRLPNDEIRESVAAAAAEVYGADQVVDLIETDDGVFSALWMYSAGPLLQAMSVFPEYELTVEGTEFSGFINGGVTFEPNSAEFSGSYAQVLDVGVGVLTRDQSLYLVIEGHTDSDGAEATNLALSQSRAEAVMQYFIDNGIAPERLSALGKGESEPAASNDTPEGRDRNRRIEYILSSRQ